VAKLHQVTIFNDAFFIWHDGQYGTINGLKLGCVMGQQVRHPSPSRVAVAHAAAHASFARQLCPSLLCRVFPASPLSPQVDWVQVNAALGYVALLLAQVCSQTGFKFQE
jgi:hypothetical protein